jgi:hypothetical protein
MRHELSAVQQIPAAPFPAGLFNSCAISVKKVSVFFWP